MTSIAENIRTIRGRIDRAAASCGRDPGEITLVAVSKTFPIEAISEVIAAGVRKLGENRVQEAEPKIVALRDDDTLEWHLVGHLQSNKARRAVELFHVIHSLDSVKLATKLSQAAVEVEKTLSVLVQVDLGLEETKFGVRREEAAQIIEETARLPRLQLNGLMTIPPFFEDPAQTRPFFIQLRELRDTFEAAHPGCLGRKHLSMGMTHDFEVAIQEGATIVRIGTAIFGARNHVAA